MISAIGLACAQAKGSFLRSSASFTSPETQGLHSSDNVKARDLYWKPFSWLGTIRPTHPRTKPSTQRFWATFVSTTLGLEVSVIAHLLSVETGEGGQHAIIVVNSGQFCFFR
jgi:hypothetical protein